MLAATPLEEAAGMGLHDLKTAEAAQAHDLLHQGLGHDIMLSVGGQQIEEDTPHQ